MSKSNHNYRRLASEKASIRESIRIMQEEKDAKRRKMKDLLDWLATNKPDQDQYMRSFADMYNFR